jgi:hypothetical protein
MSVNPALNLQIALRNPAWLVCWMMLILAGRGYGQNPPSILRSETPPDISEKYQANPRFYEVMSAFPHPNSYTRYKFDEVQSAARHDPAMMVILGDHYRIGRSTPLDLRKALKEYEKAASKGYTMAYHRIAYMYADGLGLPKEKEKILHFLKLSADGGYHLAQYDYALIYLNGKFNEPRDFARAYKYLKMAADQQHRLSIESLAMLAIHPESVLAGLPCGLKEALDWYRKAGDTDGERLLKAKIGSFGGLRYYLRSIPDFIPGLGDNTDPTDRRQGLEIILSLASVQNLLGEELFNTYRREIAENILYRAYFEAQQQPDELLRMIVYCHQQDSILHPYQLRYNEAAGRDFRLLVNFTDASSLAPFLEQFAGYPLIFRPEELLIVSDRVYVALMLKENPENLHVPLDQFLLRNPWIIQNMSSRYIAHFETQQFARHRQQLVNTPYQGGDYLVDVFSRYAAYRSSETDTLEKAVIPGIRLHCLHPFLTDLLITNISGIHNEGSAITDLLGGLKKAQETFKSDINTYWTLLLRKPAELLRGVGQTSDAPSIVTQIRNVMQQAGEKQLDKICRSLRDNETGAFTILQKASAYETMEMMTGSNLQRFTAISQWSLRNLLMVSNCTFTDPNGVIFVPLITKRELPDPGNCAEKIPEHNYRIYQTSSIHLSAASITLTNNSEIPLIVSFSLMNAEAITPEATGAFALPAEPIIKITATPIQIASGETITLEAAFPESLQIPDLVVVAEFANLHQTLILR